MNAFEIDSALLAISFLPFHLDSAAIDALAPFAKSRVSSDDSDSTSHGMLAVITYLIVLNLQGNRDALQKIANTVNESILPQHSNASKRAVKHLTRLLEYCSKDLFIGERSRIIQQLSEAFLDLQVTDQVRSSFISLFSIMRPDVLANKTTLLEFYRGIKLSELRIFYVQASLQPFGLGAVPVYNGKPLIQIFRQHSATQSVSKGQIRAALSEIVVNIKEQLEHSFGIQELSGPCFQVLSPGRSGTFFLRSLLLKHADKFVPIHNIYSVPYKENVSLFCILYSIANSDSLDCLDIDDSQLFLTCKIVECHLLALCIELFAYIKQFQKIPVIINHWICPFSFILKSIFPDLQFLSLDRDRDSLKYSLVEKDQIASNPMPPEIHFSNFEFLSVSGFRPDGYFDKINLWADYHLDLVESISGEISSKFPDSWHGTLRIAPPSIDSATKLINIFSLDCDSADIIEAPVMNFKERIG